MTAGVLFTFTLTGSFAIVAAPEAPAPIHVKTAAPQVLSPLRLEQAIYQDLLHRWRSRVSRVEVRVLAPRDPIQVPAGRLSLEVQPVPTIVRPGRVLFFVLVRVDDMMVRKQKVVAAVKAFADLALTTHGIPHGKILGPSDLERGEWRVRVIEHGLVVSPEEAIGKQLLVTLPRGRPIPQPALHDPDHDTGEAEQGPAEGPGGRAPFEGQERQPRHPPGSGGGFRAR